MQISKYVKRTYLSDAGLTVTMKDGTEYVLYDNITKEVVEFRKYIKELVAKDHMETQWSKLKETLTQQKYSDEQIEKHQLTFEIGWLGAEEYFKTKSSDDDVMENDIEEDAEA